LAEKEEIYIQKIEMTIKREGENGYAE